MTVIYGANACENLNIVSGNGYIKKMVMKGTLNCKELETIKVYILY